MERYLRLALFLALILALASYPAFAETDGVILEEEIELTEPGGLLPDTPDLDDLIDADVALDADEDMLQSTEPAGSADEDSLSNDSSNYQLTESCINIGEKERYSKLSVTMNVSNDEPPMITWRSGNRKVAKVDSRTGRITGVKKGSTTIYAKIEGYRKEIKCKVNVLKSPRQSNFSISPKNGSLKVGQVGQYRISFDSGYGGSFTFSSSDSDVASIDEEGVVTAISPGYCEITVTMYNEVEKTVSLQILENGSSENDKIEKVLQCARNKLGKPYKQGCFGSDRFDCVGFTYWCYKQVDVKLKDTTSKQAEDTRFMQVSYDELAPGDLVYFHTDDNPKVSHAALYLGDGEIIHASYTAGKVIISQLVSSSSDYYKRNFHCARRVFS
jgi:hypothetical protein